MPPHKLTGKNRWDCTVSGKIRPRCGQIMSQEALHGFEYRVAVWIRDFDRCCQE